MVILSNPAAPLEAGDIVDAVWDEAASGHVAGGSIGALVERLDILAAGGAGELTAARAALLTNLDLAISTVDTVVDAVKVVTDALPDGGALTSVKDQVIGGGGAYVLPLTNAASVEVNTGSSGNNNFGAWAELEDSLAADSYLVGWAADYTTASNSNIVIEIGVGAGGSEVSIGEYPLGGSGVAVVASGFLLDPPRIFIASGSRIAVRVRDASSSAREVKTYLAMVLASDMEAWDAE